MTTIERILKQAATKNYSNTELEKALELTPKTINNWIRGKSKTYFKLLPQIAQVLEVKTDSLIGEDAPENLSLLASVMKANKAEDYVATDNGKSQYHLNKHTYLYAKHKLGEEDANLMFQIAEISIEDDKNDISQDALDWIGIHCDVPGDYFLMKEAITLMELEDPSCYYVVGSPVEKLMERPNIAKWEETFQIKKCEKYAAKERTLKIKSYDGRKREVVYCFDNIINQFDTNLDMQYFLLNQFKKMADTIAVHSNLDAGQSLKLEYIAEIFDEFSRFTNEQADLMAYIRRGIDDFVCARERRLKRQNEYKNAQKEETA